MTFSIVARDGRAREWGVAVASKFLGVGSIVPWARAEAGAVATQAWANPDYGARGLQLLEAGHKAHDVVAQLTGDDEGRDHRQVGVVDAQGHGWTFTGERCMPWAGGRKGRNYACQGNILASGRVVDAMAETFESTEGDLAGRLVSALQAGEAAGGDRRGRQSAALMVVKPQGGYGAREHGWTFDRLIDLRVDDHPDPVRELARLLELWRLHFTKPRDRGLELTGRTRSDVSRALRKLGYLAPKEPFTPEAFRRFLHMENLEERELSGLRIDRDVLAWLKQRERRATSSGEGK